MRYLMIITSFLFLFVIANYAPASGGSATAELKNAQGQAVGIVMLMETPHGVLLKAELWDLPKGTHAFHIHAVGTCEPPFKSAGGHYNPYKKQHGIMNKKGKHAGDLPNIYSGSDGKLTFEVLADQVTLGKGKNSLFDKDGSAIVIHAGPDDYKSDPAGSAGPRIACGVIKK